MVYLNIPGVPNDLNVEYRPPRVSLFPPSYRERGYLRAVQRHMNRQLKEKAKNESAAATAAASTAVTTPEVKSRAIQTTETHCYHECDKHPAEGNGGGGGGMKDASTNTGKHDKRGKGYRQGYNGDDSSSSDDSDDDDWRQNKKKAKRQQKGGKHVKWDNGEDAMRRFMPYPLSSPNAVAMFGNNPYQMPYPGESPSYPNTPGWNLDYKNEVARRGDERYMWNYLGQHMGNQQQDGFKWLAERDSQRQAYMAQAANGIANLSLDPRADITPLAFPANSHYPGYHHPQNFPHQGYPANPPPPYNMPHGQHGAHSGQHPCRTCDTWHQANHAAAQGPNQPTANFANQGNQQHASNTNANANTNAHPFFADSPQQNDRRMSGAIQPPMW